ncbi:MAG: WXG100 family type VII secretion target [Stackebrandtia sp.]
MNLIQANFGSMEATQGDLGQKVEQLMQVIEDLMAKVNSTEWEAADRGAYQDLQEMWNGDDGTLQEVLSEISGQVGVAQQGYQQTISQNAARF